MRFIALLANSLLAFGTVHAAGLDTTFGSGGKLLPAIGAPGSSQATNAILQADGKIVIVGSTPASVESLVQSIAAPAPPDPSRDFFVLRLNGDGSLDPTFGQGGIVRIDFNHDDDRAQAVVQQPDGKLVVVGSARINHGVLAAAPDFDLAAARLLPSGELDTSFGSGGKVTVNIPGDPTISNPFGTPAFVYTYPPDHAYSVALQADGKLLIGGSTEQYNVQAPSPTLTRLTADGAVDTTFGLRNTGTIVVQSEYGAAYSTLQEANGSILVTSAIGPFEIDATGQMASFVGPDFFGPPLLYGVFALAIEPGGKILFAGGKNVNQPDGSTQLRWMVTRTLTPGVADSTFGTAGSEIGPDGLYEQFLTSIALDSGGKLLAGGVISSGPDVLSRQDALILRLQNDGTPDVNFGIQGVIQTDFSDATTQYSYRQAALLRQSDGKLLMVGNRGTLNSGGAYYPSLAQSSVQIALARFNSTPEFAIAANTATVSNTAGSIGIQVSRIGTTTGSVSVNYATSDGTANAGTDYTATNGTLTWLASDGDSKTITIPITNNGLTSGSRTFSVTLSNQTDGSITSPSIVVTIQDNAAPPTTTSPPANTSNGGGGGGSVDWWILGVLGAAAVKRRSARNRG